MMYKLTKLDVAAIRHGDHLIVHLRNDGGTFDKGKEVDGRAWAVYVLKDRAQPTPQQPYPEEHEHPLNDVPVTVNTYHQRAEIANVRCFASVPIYKYSRGVLHLLRTGDEISLEFMADGGNLYVRNAGLYDDRLYLNVRRGREEFRFELAESVTPDNQARMVRGARRIQADVA